MSLWGGATPERPHSGEVPCEEGFALGSCGPGRTAQGGLQSRSSTTSVSRGSRGGEWVPRQQADASPRGVPALATPALEDVAGGGGVGALEQWNSEELRQADASGSGVPVSLGPTEGGGTRSRAIALERCECGELVVASRFAEHVLSHFQDSEGASKQGAAVPPCATHPRGTPTPGTGTGTRTGVTGQRAGKPVSASSTRGVGRKAVQGRGGGGGRRERQDARMDGSLGKTATLGMFLLKKA